jgi:hypothetical protein
LGRSCSSPSILNAGKAFSDPGPALGAVELRWKALAREAFTDPETVQRVVSEAAALGLLDRVRYEGDRFSARLPKSARWDTQPKTGAERTAAWRERKRAAEAEA